MHPIQLALAAALALAAIFPASADDDQKKTARPPETLLVTRSLEHQRLIPYLRDARPAVAQIGNYGAMFHGYADNPKSTGWPMQLPVAGQRAALEYQRKLNRRAHQLGLQVVGHFRLVKVMGDWQQRSGFVEFYDRGWPRDLLGPKPHPQLAELLQRDADGTPIQLGRYNQPQLALCLSSPHARRMLKQMLKVAVDQGVDGVITTYNYRYACGCRYCQRDFKAWLGRRLSAAELRRRLGIEDLQAHDFGVVPAAVPGYPDPTSAGELQWLAARWGAEHFKEKFDEIFLHYGRSLNGSLLVAQWNHLGHVKITEERMFLPPRLWGRGEDYFWYSGGASFVGKNLSLREGRAGDAWLSCLYVREMSGGKPFVIGKYDRTRMAASMAEGFATGGLGMGRYMRFEEPAGYDVLVRYTKFRQQRRRLYDRASPYADVGLVLPRQSAWNRRPQSLDAFRQLGQELVERQLLLDVVADHAIDRGRLAKYRGVVLPQAVALSDEQLAALRDFADGGGRLLVLGEMGAMDETGRPRESPAEIGDPLPAEDSDAAAEAVVAAVAEAGGAAIDAPWTVRAAACRQADRLVLHLVNYDRQEDAPENNRTGPAAELPRAAEKIAVRLPLPAGRRAGAVRAYAPDRPGVVELRFDEAAGAAAFTVPRVEVYAVVAVELQPQD